MSALAESLFLGGVELVHHRVVVDLGVVNSHALERLGLIVEVVL